MKNHALPLTFDQTHLELIKFEEKARDRYNCQNFRLVSVNGYVQEAGKLGVFNMLLDGWEHVAELVERYDSQSKTVPQIELKNPKYTNGNLRCSLQGSFESGLLPMV